MFPIYILLIVIFLAILDIPETIKENGMSPADLAAYQNQKSEHQLAFGNMICRAIWWVACLPFKLAKAVLRRIFRVLAWGFKWVFFLSLALGALVLFVNVCIHLSGV